MSRIPIGNVFNHLRSTVFCARYEPVSTLLYTIEILIDKISKYSYIKERFRHNILISEPWMLPFLRGKYKTVLDIGAHEGNKYTVYFSKRAERVFAFEPFEDSFAKLEQTVGGYSNINPLKIALSDKEEDMDFYIHDSSVKNSFMKKSGLSIKIKTTTLDKLVEKMKLDNISLIKIDTEGMDHLILEGGRNTLKEYKPELVIEFHDNREEILKELQSVGYTWKIVRQEQSSDWKDHGWIYAS